MTELRLTSPSAVITTRVAAMRNLRRLSRSITDCLSSNSSNRHSRSHYENPQALLRQGELHDLEAYEEVEPDYPPALPSTLREKFDGPVLGTAVIDRDNESFMAGQLELEMVPPHEPPLLDAQVKEGFTAAFNNDSSPEGSSPLSNLLSPRVPVTQLRPQWLEMPFGAAGSSASPDASGRRMSRGDTANPLDPSLGTRGSCSTSSSHGTVTLPNRRHLIEEGGCIVFSDKFLAENPESPFAVAASKYSTTISTSPPSSERALPRLSTNDEEEERELTEEQQKLRQVRSYIREVEEDRRPIFRRRSSVLIYGRSAYSPSGSHQASPKKPLVSSPGAPAHSTANVA